MKNNMEARMYAYTQLVLARVQYDENRPAHLVLYTRDKQLKLRRMQGISPSCHICSFNTVSKGPEEGKVAALLHRVWLSADSADFRHQRLLMYCCCQDRQEGEDLHMRRKCKTGTISRSVPRRERDLHLSSI